MHERHFGDSYDIVKQSLIRWLSRYGEWIVHPMFTELVTEKCSADFQTFLGARIICTDSLPRANRRNYFNRALPNANLFLDPDIGLRIDGKCSPRHLLGNELVSLVKARPKRLTMVFDQSFRRGEQRVADRDYSTKKE